MKCEICRTIESLGLDPKAHDLWFCADTPAKNLAFERARMYLQYLGRQVCAFVILKARQRRAMAAFRHQSPLVTLGL